MRFGGLVALDRVSLEALTGEVHGVIGPNGAGKTTLFNVICGFVRPNSGSLNVMGQQFEKMRPDALGKLGIARTLQGLGLFGRMTVLENVMVGATPRARVGYLRSFFGAGASVAEERKLRQMALDTVERLGLGPYATRLPPSLPYALQKKVALARSLVLEPKFLLLDEPASGLSDDEMAELGDLILHLTKELGVVLVEHHMDLVMRICSKITVLDFGRVIAEGTPEAVKNNPLVTEAYLGEDVST